MESYPFAFPLSDIKAIMRKLKMAIQPIYKEFIGKYLGNAFQSVPLNTMQHIYICYDTTRNALIDLLNDRITEHEIITFARHFRAAKNDTKFGSHDRHKMQALVQLDLERDLWDDLERLKELLYEMDPVNLSGYMPPERLYSIVVGCRLPIKSVSIDDMFAVYALPACNSTFLAAKFIKIFFCVIVDSIRTLSETSKSTISSNSLIALITK